MTEGTSERACDKCRERRVKCDKRQPSCVRCEKLGQSCPGYNKKRKFVDQSDTLRKKYQTVVDPSPSSESVATIPTQGKGEGISLTQSINATPLSITRSITGHPNESNVSSRAFEAPSSLPKSLTVFRSANNSPSVASDVLNDGSADIPLVVERPAQIQDLDTDTLLDELWQSATYDPEWFDLDPEEYYGNGNNSCGFIPNAQDIVSENYQTDLAMTTIPSASPFSAGFDTFSDSNVWATESQLNTSVLIMEEREHEMAYLVRHFTETLGPWMDLFDTDKHFTHLVPLKALRDALLRNAIAAVAAKQLGRIRGVKTFVATQTQKPSTMEVLDDVGDVDWFYKAANYYDKAIAFSRHYLQAFSGSLCSPASSSTHKSLSNSSEDLLLGVSLFSLYESLDNFDASWLQHLIGLKSLLDAANADQKLPAELRPPITAGRMASFWNFVRADYQAAYINRQRTFLDTEDLPLWHDCGLQIQADGMLYHLPTSVKNDTTRCRISVELVTHTLLWIVLRVMNYIANENNDEVPSARQAHWEQITSQLDCWHTHLPSMFQPVARMRRMASALKPRGTARLTEMFFSIDACAAGLQLYHFTRILLLLHRPPSKDAALWGGRLEAYREVSREAIKHAHEIVGIALGRPHPAIRVEMLLPLYISGLCLEADDERGMVLELLKAIEMDTGYSTEVRCQELVTGWGWNQEIEGIA